MAFRDLYYGVAADKVEQAVLIGDECGIRYRGLVGVADNGAANGIRFAFVELAVGGVHVEVNMLF